MRFHRRLRSRRLALAAAVPAFAALAAPPADAQMSRAEQVRLIDSIAASPVAEGRVAGLAVAVVRGRDTLLLKSYGKADLEWDVPLTTDAVFEIGSVTKQFTAAAVLQLRDEGKLDLDADIGAYLPDFPTQGHRIPVRRLLDHTSGIRGVTEIPEFRRLSSQEGLPRDSMIRLIAAQPFDFAPGEALIYNNSAYILLGLIIEKVSGMTYEDYVEKKIFAPLGMSRSSYCSSTDVVPRRAHGYQLRDRVLHRRQHVSHIWPFSAGSLCSSAGDLLRWLRAVHGGEALPAASYREMITPGRLADGTGVRYAMGLDLSPDAAGRPTIHHGGAIPGFAADTRYYPDADLYVVTLVNSTGNLSPAALAAEMADVLMPPVAPERRAFQGDAAALVGTYSGRGRGQDVTVTVTATPEGLAVARGEGRPAPLRWVEGLTFAVGGNDLVIFDRPGGAGPATVLRVDTGGGHYVLRRQPGG